MTVGREREAEGRAGRGEPQKMVGCTREELAEEGFGDVIREGKDELTGVLVPVLVAWEGVRAGDWITEGDLWFRKTVPSVGEMARIASVGKCDPRAWGDRDKALSFCKRRRCSKSERT